MSAPMIREGPPQAERLLRIAVFCLCVGIPIQQLIVLPKIGAISNLLVPAGLFIGMLAVIDGVRLARFPRAAAWLTAFITWAIASYFWSPYQSMTMQRGITYVQLLVFFGALAVATTTPGRRRWGLVGYLVGAYMVASTVILNFLTGARASQIASAARYAAGSANPNRTAAALVLGIAFAGYLVNTASKGRFAFVAYLIVAPFAVLLTASRAGLVGLTTTGVLILVWISRKRGRHIRLLAFIGIGLVILASYVPESSLDRATNLDGEGLAGSAVEIRADALDVGIDAFTRKPIIGNGAGSFPVLMDEAGLLFIVAHNSWVSIAAELGVVGLALFTGAVISASIPGLRARGQERWFILLVLAGWLPSFFFASFEDDKITWIAIAFLASMSSVPNQADPTNNALAEMAHGVEEIR